MNEKYMEFLCWLDRCLYPGDFVIDLEKEGMSYGAAAAFVMGVQRPASILTIYQDYCLNEVEEGDVGFYVKRYIDSQYKIYEQIEGSTNV